MAATSATEILNDALVLIGEPPVHSITDDVKRARLGRVLYDKIRDELLRKHNWNFATTRTTLTTKSDVSPAYGFSNAFALPPDFLRFAQPEIRTLKFALEDHQGQRSILTDLSQIAFRYVADVTDVNRFDDVFKRCLAYRIAADLCISMTKNQALRDRMRAEFQDMIDEAQFADHQEAPIEVLEPTEFIDARFASAEDTLIIRGVEGISS